MVEYVADGLLDAVERRLKQSSHGIGAQPQHALRRPAYVAAAVLANQTLHSAALRRQAQTPLGLAWTKGLSRLSDRGGMSGHCNK